MQSQRKSAIRNPSPQVARQVDVQRRQGRTSTEWVDDRPEAHAQRRLLNLADHEQAPSQLVQVQQLQVMAYHRRTTISTQVTFRWSLLPIPGRGQPWRRQLSTIL